MLPGVLLSTFFLPISLYMHILLIFTLFFFDLKTCQTRRIHILTEYWPSALGVFYQICNTEKLNNEEQLGSLQRSFCSFTLHLGRPPIQVRNLLSLASSIFIHPLQFLVQRSQEQTPGSFVSLISELNEEPTLAAISADQGCLNAT